MNIDFYIKGIIPADEKYQKMLKVHNMCKELGISAPVEVVKFFDYRDYPDPSGYSEYLCNVNMGELPNFVISNAHNSFDLVVDKIPSKYKIIRCYLG
jgi:hypothetical protein